MSEPTFIECDEIEATIEDYRSRGYHLDMIFPADSPREALVSVPPAVVGGLGHDAAAMIQSKSVRLMLSGSHVQPPATAGGTD